MLTLSRKAGDRVVLVHPDGTRVTILVELVKGGKVRLGIEAPREVQIFRDELIRPSAGTSPAANNTT